MKLYLITGFLGAGKTTFLKNLIPLFSKEKMALLINEFGKEGVDGTLLADLGIRLSEINNGSIFCSCRLDRFEEVLEEMLVKAPDVLLVEASGLSDPTNIRKVLEQNERFQEIEYRGSLCLCDAVNFHKVFQIARVCKTQLAVSDLIFINKCDLVDEEQITSVETILQEQQPDATIFRTSFGIIQPEWKEQISNLKPTPAGSAKHRMDITLQKRLITIGDGFTVFSLKKFVEMVAPETYRIKGFVKLEDQIHLLDCVQGMVRITPYSGQVDQKQLQKIVVLAGNGLHTKKALDEAMNWYGNLVVKIE